MSKLIIDLLNGSKIILSKNRNSRPIECKNKDYIQKNQEYSSECPFCRGNESMTKNQTYIIEENNKWLVRSVLNKFPILDYNDENQLKGIHEVMIDTYRHNGSFYNMNKDEFYNLLLMYKDRYNNLRQDTNSKYVCIFKNYLRESGASLMHPHSQIISLPLIPPELEKEYEICDNFYKKMGINIYENIIKEEININKRVIYNSKDFFVYMPHESKYCGETIIIFKNSMEFQYINEKQLDELANILYRYFKKMYNEGGNCPFNIYIHTHPINMEKDYKDIFNVHIHIVPRKFNLGGFELSTGLYVSSGCPEYLVKKLQF